MKGKGIRKVHLSENIDLKAMEKQKKEQPDTFASVSRGWLKGVAAVRFQRVDDTCMGKFVKHSFPYFCSVFLF